MSEWSSRSFESTRTSLARKRLEGAEARAQAAAHATRVSALALGVERVGLWRFTEDDRSLVCQCMYSLSAGTHAEGHVLDTSRCPTYAGALREQFTIAASDALTHPCTRELRETYLEPLGIGSLLNAPLVIQGRVIGVLSHEHVSSPRQWEQRELDFAGSMADMIAMIERQAARAELEAAQREQEERDQQTAKLEAVGRLARAAAHDFNNVLTTVMLLSETLLQRSETEVNTRARGILNAAEMGSRIARRLLVLGREEPSQPVRLRLDQAVHALFPLLRARLSPQVELSAEVSAHDPVVHADPSQIERILLHLCSNAGDAIRGQGRVQITVREPGTSEARSHRYVVLEVMDDGVGVNAQIKAHLFEPYFTTKPNGNGVGLASVYGIVKQLRGRIYFESEPGRGAKVVVVLPRA